MSRILLLSDIHANLAALEAVLADADKAGKPDQVWSLGDAVGYGPKPSECLMRLQELGAVAVTGNHELAALGELSLEDFNPHARRAAEWTGENLTAEARTYAESLPHSIESGEFTLVHGSPRDPIWEYVVDADDAKPSLEALETRNCVNGHTHVPVALYVPENGADEQVPAFEDAAFVGTGRWFINPGSVGQPRDGDPRAAYAVLDDESMVVNFHRVEYAVEQTQALMKDNGLPEVLWQRLEYGF